MPTISERFKNSWNAFFNAQDYVRPNGESSYYRPDRTRFSVGNDKSIVSAIYNRIAIDVSTIDIRHVRLDYNGRFKEDIDSPLNDVFTLSANLDQTARMFRQDIVMSLFDEGCVAILPTQTSVNPKYNNSYEIYSMRVAQILEWFPDSVRVKAYNEKIGRKEELIVPKSMVAIVENPLYAIMNEPNSTLKRLILKLNLLDAIDKQSGAGKLDLIIQLPYSIKTEGRRVQAENRRKDIEMQLAGSKYGIAYTDATEQITQLNRPVENNLMNQIEFLTKTLYSQLGLTEEIMNGTANAEAMLNYYNRTVEPIISAIVDELDRKFITITARSQGQAIKSFRDPFKLVPVNQLAEMADKFTRNEIMSSNELRAIMGLKPSQDPAADELRNKNLNQAAGDEGTSPESMLPESTGPEDAISQADYLSMNSELDELDAQLDELEGGLR